MQDGVVQIVWTRFVNIWISPFPAFSRIGMMYPSTLFPHVFFPTGKCYLKSARTKSVLYTKWFIIPDPNLTCQVIPDPCSYLDPDHTLKLKTKCTVETENRCSKTLWVFLSFSKVGSGLEPDLDTERSPYPKLGQKVSDPTGSPSSTLRTNQVILWTVFLRVYDPQTN